ncbi:hypothetical protein DVH24_028951 [Malus domestica]|uniref:Ubiquitin-like domain-containing protein n=1 Tax=Malus domestica TaxID=3750 RepID=A0A498HTZ0_MALDO|nr:hypothetical protein DVH24_028951 [Malus domestica]
MYIRVKRSKTTYFIQCEPTETSLDIKQKLHDLTDQPVNNQRLILVSTGEVLEDSKTLADQKMTMSLKRSTLYDQTTSISLVMQMQAIVERARLSGLHTSAEKPCPSFPPPPSFAEIEAQRSAGDVKNKYEGIWRLSKLGVSVDKDPGKDFLGVSDGLLEQIAKVLEFPGSFDAADGGLHASNVLKEPKFVYIVEMDVDKLLSLDPRTWGLHSELEPKVGLVEHMPEARKSGDSISIIYDL